MNLAARTVIAVCDVCQDAFRDWLKQRYGSLDHVNDAWWNAFWGHNLNDWQQFIPMIVFMTAWPWTGAALSPKLHLIICWWKKLPVRGFSNLPVTTNFMGRFQPLDYWRFAEHIDVISNDCYPAYGKRGDETAHANTASVDSDLMRSMASGKPWLLMESTPSNLNWAAEYTLKRPGVHQREMRQHIGLGADGTCYFQWRKSRGGSEKHHGAVVDHEGSERTRVFQDIASHGAALKNMAGILGTGVDAAVAVVQDWEKSVGTRNLRMVRYKLIPPKAIKTPSMPTASPCVDAVVISTCQKAVVIFRPINCWYCQ